MYMSTYILCCKCIIPLGQIVFDSKGIYNHYHKKECLHSWKNIVKSEDNLSCVIFTFVAIQQFN